MKIRTIVATAVVAIVLAQPASAFWLYQKHESAFDDGALHVAFSAAVGANPGGLGVRCKDGKAEIMYIVMDSGLTSNDANNANKIGAMKLKMRIDKGEIKDYPVHSSVNDDKYIMVFDIDRSVAEQMRDAKKSISVTASLAGQNFWENTFSVTGSTDVIGKTLALCDSSATN
ncbi:hypothetical protein [Ensifer sp. Root127]|uniref:hypothetical protein n=1 Tax=Ensifer sp. Root127 TaxID=1736440 RepID=UPI00070F4EB4|nr:hypothetical protein [Ensifer sp. Root127]KQW82052.1 hypothetical protein ASD03_23325 [Ensifer sp. Root127]